MKFLRLYLRVLELLGREARLGWILALANLALASAMFVEPLLFGRIIDTLANAQARVSDLQLRDLMLLLAAWVGFALFAIVCSTLVALHADRLAHRQYQVVRTMFFEHVLQLPLSYYTGSHSGRLVKVMMTGTNTLWALWLAFFREHFASFVSLIVLMPLTLFINWRYGLLLIVLCCIFAMLIALVVSKSEQLQSTVERYYSDVAERTTDTLGNIALVQSFARIESEVSGMKKMGDEVLSAQIPVLSWWAVAAVLTRAATTLTLLVILVAGAYLKLVGLASVGAIVSFMALAALLIARLEHTELAGAPARGRFEAGKRPADRPIPRIDRKAVVMDRDQGPGPEQFAGEGRLLGLHRRGEWARRLQVREVDHRSVDRREEDVEGTVAASHPPPIAVEDRVPEMKDALPVGFDQPGHLGVAEPVHGRQRGDRERPHLCPLPDLGHRSPEAHPLELGVGLCQGEVLRVAPTGPDRLVYNGVGCEGLGQRSGIGVVAMQMTDQSGDGGSRGLGRNDGGQLDSAEHVLPERGEGGAGIGEGVDHQRRPISLDLHPGPTEPPDPHLVLLSRLSFIGRAYGISFNTCPAVRRPQSPRPAPR